MAKSNAILVTALISLALCCASFAHAKPETEKAQATVLTGTVMSVDAKAGTLTVKTKDREIKLTTDSKSTKAALEKLRVGDTARVFTKGGTVVAASPVKTEPKMKVRQ